MNKNLNSAIDMVAELAISETQDEVFSKVCGRENYVITLYDGEVIFYGTKREWLNRGLYRRPLSIAFRFNHFKFTYKKDWLATLKTLGVNL